ncbi:MAG: hypothetical protein K6C35_03440 [Eubacterium sp.]|nr:hypothetical protein [Eubacterium sp.]
MKSVKRLSKSLVCIALAFIFCISGLVEGRSSLGVEAAGNSATVYGTLKNYMKYGSYGNGGYLATNYWSCAGWVSRVLYTAGLAGEFNGYVPDFAGYASASASGLEQFLIDDSHFNRVAYFNDGYGGDAADTLLAQIESGQVKAGDIIIYYGYGANLYNTYSREHAAIILEEKYNGYTSNNTGYGEGRWGSGYYGHPTIAHSLNYSYGVEFYTPIDGHFYVGDATGYAVYRINEGCLTGASVKLESDKEEKIKYKPTTAGRVRKVTYKGVTGWYYTVNGKVNPKFTGFAFNKNGWWYIKNGKVDFSANGVIKGKLAGRDGWWYVKDGRVRFKNTVAKNQYGWWCIRCGQVDFSYTGFAKNEYGWWYINGGQVNFNANGYYYGFIDYDYDCYYVSNGKVSY